MLGVLRGFLPAAYGKYAAGRNPCAALIIEKISPSGLKTKFVLMV
jgi:hypothetical protein